MGDFTIYAYYFEGGLFLCPGRSLINFLEVLIETLRIITLYICYGNKEKNKCYCFHFIEGIISQFIVFVKNVS